MRASLWLTPRPISQARAKALAGLLAGLLACIPGSLRAEVVVDPAGDFLASYIGSTNPDMDVLSSEVVLDVPNSTLRFTGTEAGAIGTTDGAYFVWGLDRGQGTEMFGALGPGVLFDSVVALREDGTGFFLDLLTPTPVPQDLPANAITINGNTISATVPLSMIPSAGFAASDYTWNLWPEELLAAPNYVSDFAPDARNASLTVIPEPNSVALIAVGLAALAGLWARKQAWR